MQSIIKIFLLLLLAFTFDYSSVWAADYDLASPTIELQRIQYCDKCHNPLIVTTIPPGAAIRCPKTGYVMKRLPDSELEVKVYQVCPSCGTRMDVSKLKSFQPFKCGSCGLVQRVLPEAVYLPPTGAGKGSISPVETVGAAPETAGSKIKTDSREPVVPGLNAPEYSTSSAGAGDKTMTAGNGDSTATSVNTVPRQTLIEPATPEMKEVLSALPTAGETLKAAVYVNGEGVSESEVYRTLARNFEILRLNRYISGTGKPTMQQLKDIRKKVIDELVDRKLVVQAAQKIGYKPLPDTVAAIAKNTGLTMEQARDEAIIEAMRRRYSGAEGSFDEQYLRRFYDDNIELFSEPDKYLLRAVIIYVDRSGRVDGREAEVIASEVSHKIKYGVDFSALASRYSEGPFRSDGGKLRTSSVDGLVPVSNLARPVRRKLEAFAPGKVVGPIALPGCIAFFKMDNFIRGNARDFKQVYNEVKYQARINARDKAFDEWVASLRRAALIEFPRTKTPAAKDEMKDN